MANAKCGGRREALLVFSCINSVVSQYKQGIFLEEMIYSYQTKYLCVRDVFLKSAVKMHQISRGKKS